MDDATPTTTRSPDASPGEAPARAVADASAGTARPARRPVTCSTCEAVCCRLTVVLMPHDDVPHWLVQEDPHGPDTMARGDDGWCIALDRNTMRCSIYHQRPQVCRDFSMGGAYCRSERANWARGLRRGAAAVASGD